ncbi:hypothetical protein KEM60_00416 [Austwickia sp. TVS 96-490-7B]|nr:hypothetical protein [Austwickia sp. TVS 96-490-7B]
MLFLTLGVLWGIPYLLIKYAIVSFTPATLVMIRTTVGGLILLPLALRQNAFRPLRHHRRAVVAYTIAEIGIPWLALTHAEHTLSSGLAALLIAAVPVVGVILSAATGHREHLGVTGSLGLAIGLIGVALLVGREIQAPTGPDAIPALAEMVLVVLGYAIGPMIIARHLQDVPSSGVIVTSLLGPAVVLAPVGLAQWPDHVEPSALVAVLVLSVLCTTVAFLALFALVAEVGSVRTTVVTYVNPAVAVIAGAVFLAEPITGWTIAGFVCIVGGSILVHRRGPVTPA